MKKLISLFLVFFACLTSSLGQNNTIFFNDYRKISLQFGVSRYTGAETTPLPNTLKYKYKDYTSTHFGFYCDIIQTTRFNFKVGLSTLLVRDFREFKMDETEIPDVDRDVDLYVEGAGSWRLNLPIIAEYMKTTKVGILTFNGGLIVGYSEEFGPSITKHSIRANSDSEFTSSEAVYSRSTSPWYLNGQLGVGMYFPFKGWMLRTNLFYNFALQELYEGTFEFKNLQQSPDTSGDFSFRGNSFGIEFSVYLAMKNKNQKKKVDD